MLAGWGGDGVEAAEWCVGFDWDVECALSEEECGLVD